MAHSLSTGPDLADQILEEIDRIVQQAEASDKPLELDPARSRLFELFVAAQGAGYLDDDSERDLSSDGLCQALAEQWGLRSAAMESTASQSKLPQEQLTRMRHLWSILRMWMEWDYAWSRWDEFHREGRCAH
ncbi:MAG: hypothetical protein KF861_13920 [Planctomycetaceae bacterium]|nr:hypothetical protein [Planctomycetaceae bacterium]